MAYNEKDQKDQTSIVDETLDLFDKYSQKRDQWAQQAKEDKEFRLGRQWSAEQKEVLESRGQAPIVINRVHPAVESAKAMLTSNRPSFRCAPREDSDNKIAQVMSNMLAYMYVYQDPMMDMGKGEVCFHDVDPLDVYVDPNSRNKLFDDAENIIISKLFTKEQAQSLYPMYKSKIDNASNSGAYGKGQDFNAPSTIREGDGEVQFPEDVGRLNEKDYIRGYERYYKMDIPEYRVFETFSNKEFLLNEEDYQNYLKKPAYFVEGQLIIDPHKAGEVIAQLQKQSAFQFQAELEEMEAAGYDEKSIFRFKEKGPKQVEYRETTHEELLKQERIKAVQVLIKRIKQCVIIGVCL